MLSNVYRSRGTTISVVYDDEHDFSSLFAKRLIKNTNASRERDDDDGSFPADPKERRRRAANEQDIAERDNTIKNDKK